MQWSLQIGNVTRDLYKDGEKSSVLLTHAYLPEALRDHQGLQVNVHHAYERRAY